jgi:hypothetical protein
MALKVGLTRGKTVGKDIMKKDMATIEEAAVSDFSLQV